EKHISTIWIKRMCVDNMSDLRKQIKKLLNSKITGYRIYKDTGLSQTIISELRTGKRNLDNISLKNAEILAEYAKLHLNE
ncbi:hypothetical protein, partial [Staphylococcus nepalensis]|uniref:hypothetical protein n=1 Tax=Staphylococcus nepalensis TaxID=214473 RepID=UPI003983E6B0